MKHAHADAAADAAYRLADTCDRRADIFPAGKNQYLAAVDHLTRFADIITAADDLPFPNVLDVDAWMAKEAAREALASLWPNAVDAIDSILGQPLPALNRR